MKDLNELYPDAWDDDLYPTKLQWRVNAERQAYKDGYTDAATDLSAENEKLKFESQNYADLYRASLEVVNQYKEALRELVEDIEESKVYSTLANIPMYKALITPEIFDKAKQLITDEK